MPFNYFSHMLHQRTFCVKPNKRKKKAPTRRVKSYEPADDGKYYA